MRFKFFILAFATLLGLNVQAQESSVEKVDSTSFERIRFRVREKVQLFRAYYHFIADKKQDGAEKALYIQRATELFLPEQGIIVSSFVSSKSQAKKEKRQTVKSFLENTARGLYRTTSVVTVYEFCHNCSQRLLSESEAEITFCQHHVSLRNNGNICIMPKDSVTRIMPPISENEHLIYLTTLYCDITE